MATEEEFTFEDFCRKYEISEKSVETLKKEDINSIAVLEIISIEELQTLEFSIGQRLLLFKGVKDVQEAAARREEKKRLQERTVGLDQVDATENGPRIPVHHEPVEAIIQGSPDGFGPEPTESEGLLKRHVKGKTSDNGVQEQWRQGPEPPVDVPKAISEKRMVNKNIFAISIAFLMVFSAYIGFTIIQSTIFGVAGVVGTGVLCTASGVGCFGLACIATNAFGSKRTILVAIAMFLLWMATHFYVRMWTIVPAAFISGMGNGPLWTAQSKAFTQLGFKYHQVTGESEEAVLARFFGLFYCFVLFGASTGCGIVSLILSSSIGDPPPDVSAAINVTVPSWPVGVLPQCGKGYCPGVIAEMMGAMMPVYNGTNGTTGAMDDSQSALRAKVMVVIGVLTCVTALAFFVVFFFADELPRPERMPILRTIKTETLKMVRQQMKRRQLLMVPINFYTGLSISFLLADISESFVACALGVEMIGYALMTWGIISCIASISCGFIIKYTGRLSLFTFCGLLRLGLILFLSIWTVDNTSMWIFFLIPSLWAIGDGILISQINAMYGYMYYESSESAFAIYRLYESFGLMVGYFVNSVICLVPKLYFMISLQIVGWILYYVTEVIQRRVERKQAEGKVTEQVIEVNEVNQDIGLKLSSL